MSVERNTWFSVDRDGLEKLLATRSPAHVLFELVQNAMDTMAKNINVTFTPQEGRPLVDLVVEDDDPDGFADLSHAWTLFAESAKKNDPMKRGRFNLGEKLVIARCEWAQIETTKGTVIFDRTGRHQHRHRRASGSRFSAVVRMTRAEYAEACVEFLRFIPKPETNVVFRGEKLVPRHPVQKIATTLVTDVADVDGVLRRSKRATTIELFEPFPGEPAMIYEMGIPIVETGDRWHVNVDQKVPLTMDRDNVPPGYLRAVRTAVLNAAHEKLTEVDATQPWVREAAGSPLASKESIADVLRLRFGDKVVTADPSDPEAMIMAAEAGYKVIHGGALSSDEWQNVKRDQLVLPAGRVTPSHLSAVPTSDYRVITELTEAMREITLYSKCLARVLLGIEIKVRIIDGPKVSSMASWSENKDSPCVLTFNVAHLGPVWFERGVTVKKLELLIHEFAHHVAGNHRSVEYYDALTALGVKLAILASRHPQILSLKLLGEPDLDALRSL